MPVETSTPERRATVWATKPARDNRECARRSAFAVDLEGL